MIQIRFATLLDLRGNNRNFSPPPSRSRNDPRQQKDLLHYFLEATLFYGYHVLVVVFYVFIFKEEYIKAKKVSRIIKLLGLSSL